MLPGTRPLILYVLAAPTLQLPCVFQLDCLDLLLRGWHAAGQGHQANEEGKSAPRRHRAGRPPERPNDRPLLDVRQARGYAPHKNTLYIRIYTRWTCITHGFVFSVLQKRSTSCYARPKIKTKTTIYPRAFKTHCGSISHYRAGLTGRRASERAIVFLKGLSCV